MNVRIPAELKTTLERAASDAGRSLTAEIVKRLQDSFPLEAQASADRVASIVMVTAMGQGVKVAPTEVSKFVQGMIRTTRDKDALRKLVVDLGAAIAQVRGQKNPRAAEAPARRVKR